MSSGPVFASASLFWDYEPETRILLIAIKAPVEYLAVFTTPGHMMQQFLEVVSARGIGIGRTDSMRAVIDKGAGTFVIRWAGEVDGGDDLQSIMGPLAKYLEMESV
jgi:hypothetical protein